MVAKQQAMEQINEYMAKHADVSTPAEDANILEEEAPDDVDEGDDEIQQLAGAASHKKKKRKTGF